MCSQGIAYYLCLRWRAYEQSYGEVPNINNIAKCVEEDVLNPLCMLTQSLYITYVRLVEHLKGLGGHSYEIGSFLWEIFNDHMLFRYLQMCVGGIANVQYQFGVCGNCYKLQTKVFYLPINQYVPLSIYIFVMQSIFPTSPRLIYVLHIFGRSFTSNKQYENLGNLWVNPPSNLAMCLHEISCTKELIWPHSRLIIILEGKCQTKM